MNHSILTSCLLLYAASHIPVFAENTTTSYSQRQQDVFVYDEFYSGKRDGVFVDIGAHNGIKYSNSYLLEKEYGWTGICVEPLPDVFQELRQNRDCICVNACVYDKAPTANFLYVHSDYTGLEMLSGIIDNYDPKHVTRIEKTIEKTGSYSEVIVVNCLSFNDLLSSNDVYHVDYLSIDTEGGELEILKSIDYTRFHINVIDVENNYRDPAYEAFLNTKGFVKLAKQPCTFDEIYARAELVNPV